MPGAVHDLTAARIRGILRQLAAAGFITLADKDRHCCRRPCACFLPGWGEGPPRRRTPTAPIPRLRARGEGANAQLQTWRIPRKLPLLSLARRPTRQSHRVLPAPDRELHHFVMATCSRNPHNYYADPRRYWGGPCGGMTGVTHTRIHGGNSSPVLWRPR